MFVNAARMIARNIQSPNILTIYCLTTDICGRDHDATHRLHIVSTLYGSTGVQELICILRRRLLKIYVKKNIALFSAMSILRNI